MSGRRDSASKPYSVRFDAPPSVRFDAPSSVQFAEHSDAVNTDAKDSDGGCDRRPLAGTAGARSVSMLSHQMTETREFADSSTVLVFPAYPLKIEFSHKPNVVPWKFQDAETWGNEQTHKVGCARQGR